MQIEKKDASQERRILAAMVTDSAVLAQVAAHWPKEGLFRTKWANLVGAWCVKYHRNYDRSPNRQIQGLFDRWAADNDDEATAGLVETFLEGVSDAYERDPESPSDFIVDMAQDYFNRVRIGKLSEQLKADLDSGDPTRAQQRLDESRRVEIGKGAGVDVLHSKEAIYDAFSESAQSIVVYPGALGNFFGINLSRDALVGFMASTGKAKTFWLMDLAWRAMEQKLKVAFFEIGDLSQRQIMRRFITRAMKRPLSATEKGKPVRYPSAIELPPKSRRANVTFDERRFKNDVKRKAALAACTKIIEGHKRPRLRLSCHPNGTIGVPGIVSILESWDRDNWTPDCIVIDYADLLVPSRHFQKKDEGIDHTWKELRGLSQSRHCLLATATQANAEALRADTVRLQHFSGSIGIQRHATALFGISQTNLEKRIGTMRLNVLKGREVDFDTDMPCHVAGCLAIANPAVRAIF